MNRKIKISEKSKKRIMEAVSSAFTEIVSQYECYNDPPEMWSKDERDFWDVFQETQNIINRNLKSIIE
jgi:hypothetical protein